MVNLPFFFNDPGVSDERPLPLIVAEKWNFPLAYIQTDMGLFYAIQDWIGGLAGEENTTRISKMWGEMKKRADLQTSISNGTLPYVASDGKTYQREYTDDKGLYLIAQHMRVTKSRPLLDQIKKFLAASGAFVDQVRLEPDTIVESGALTPDEALDTAIKGYRKQGKDDKWIAARLEGKIKREKFTAALSAAVADVLARNHYAIATDEIYRGLWKRTAAYLKSEMGLPKKASLRDHQPALALTYQGIAEEVAAQKLGNRLEISWQEAKSIVRTVAEFIGKQARATSEFLSVDLATGKPLLPDKRR